MKQLWKSLNIAIKNVFIEMLVAGASKHLGLLNQKDDAESSFIIENKEGTANQNTRPSPLCL